jgi:hypothetical protein
VLVREIREGESKVESVREWFGEWVSLVVVSTKCRHVLLTGGARSAMDWIDHKYCWQVGPGVLWSG